MRVKILWIIAASKIEEKNSSATQPNLTKEREKENHVVDVFMYV